MNSQLRPDTLTADAVCFSRHDVVLHNGSRMDRAVPPLDKPGAYAAFS
ncbi:hypothetical protein [Brevibacillus gelatini]|nr:hypothetical protein [Brevibacillus gelatini]